MMENALINTVLKGKVERVRRLLENGADVNARGCWYDHDTTALIEAARLQNAKIFFLLLPYGADVNAQNCSGATPLIVLMERKPWQTQHQTLEMAQALLDRGARVDTVDKSGNTALLLAAHREYEKIVRLLLDYGASVHTEGTRARLLNAARDSPEISQMLHERGIAEDANVHLEAMLQADNAELQRAAGWGNIEVVTSLLDSGADIHSSNESGWTALHYASDHGIPSIVRLLLDRGADSEAEDEDGKTPLMLASHNGYKGSFDRTWSPVLPGKIKVVQLLLERGANVHAQDKEGRFVFDYAVRGGSTEILQMLIDQDRSILLNKRQVDVALHHIRKEQNEEMLRLLQGALKHKPANS